MDPAHFCRFLYVSCVDQFTKDNTQVTFVANPTWSLHTLASLENPAFVLGPFKLLCMEVRPLLLFAFPLIEATVDITRGVWFLHFNQKWRTLFHPSFMHGPFCMKHYLWDFFFFKNCICLLRFLC